VSESAEDLRVVVDRELCMGSGLCIVYAPNTFAHDEESKAVAAEPAPDSADTLAVAVDACPTGALSLLHQEGV
jgi:ferredoxin